MTIDWRHNFMEKTSEIYRIIHFNKIILIKSNIFIFIRWKCCFSRIWTFQCFKYVLFKWQLHKNVDVKYDMHRENEHYNTKLNGHECSFLVRKSSGTQKNILSGIIYRKITVSKVDNPCKYFDGKRICRRVRNKNKVQTIIKPITAAIRTQMFIFFFSLLEPLRSAYS